MVTNCVCSKVSSHLLGFPHYKPSLLNLKCKKGSDPFSVCFGFSKEKRKRGLTPFRFLNQKGQPVQNPTMRWIVQLFVAFICSLSKQARYSGLI